MDDSFCQAIEELVYGVFPDADHDRGNYPWVNYRFSHFLPDQAENWQTGIFDNANYESSVTYSILILIDY